MELTNNPGEGTGLSVAEAATHIESLLDSPTATTEEVDADQEVQETSLPSDNDEIELEEVDTVDESDTDSEESDEAEAEVSKFEIPDEATVEINGNTVSGKELKAGYLRQSDYTKKTQELAEHYKKWEVQQHDVAQIRGMAKQELENIRARLAVEFQGLSEPDWAYLAANEPAEYVRLKEEWTRKEAAVKAIYDAQQELIRKDQEYQNHFQQKAITAATEELKRRYPVEFGDLKTAKSLLDQLNTHLVDAGFTLAELENVTDPRIIDIAYRAYKYDQMQKKIPKAVQKIGSKPALTMPGNGNVRVSSKDQAIRAEVNKLKQSGSVSDAAALISKLL